MHYTSTFKQTYELNYNFQFSHNYQCKHKCSWECEHQKCSKLCSEPCDRSLCEEADTTLLPNCQHQSIGVCGEPTPDLCSVCDRKKVEESLFGLDFENDTRFIQLKDCGHIVEKDAILTWMKCNTESNSDTETTPMAVQFKRCPHCTTTIRHTKSLNTFISVSLRDIENIKTMIHGSNEENGEKRKGLIGQIRQILSREEFSNDPYELVATYTETLHELTSPLKRSQLNAMENKLQLVERLRVICETYFAMSNVAHKNLSHENTTAFENRLEMAAIFVRQFQNSEQEISDITTEISFIQLMGDVVVHSNHQQFNDIGRRLLNEAFKSANEYGPADGSTREKFEEDIKEACDASDFKISIFEKVMILKAMGFTKGHWYEYTCDHIKFSY